ncbi:hypothetical protein [Solicola sp. PLA-1-18]|uniref:hypothetical protein n=1 Tax=Solicola sp. PLA-1-18 TaxID=3380532 RepID=UPI003B7C7563
MGQRSREDELALADPADGVGLGVDGAVCLTTPAGPRVLVAPPMGGGMEAALSGVLTDVDGYLGVGGVVVWLPAGVTLVSDDPLVLRVLDGREVGLGDAVTGGGGHTDRTLKELGIDPGDDTTTLDVFLAYVVR